MTVRQEQAQALSDAIERLHDETMRLGLEALDCGFPRTTDALRHALDAFARAGNTLAKFR